MRQSEKQWIDTLKLTATERQELLERLDESADHSKFANVRTDERVALDLPCGAVTKLYQPGGSANAYLIHPRNLSRTGMSFLHGSYVHEKSRCELFLRNIRRETAQVTGIVMWCRHVRGRVHEVGVHFNQPIVMSDFVKAPPPAREEKLRQALASINGRLLYVDDCVDDQELLAFHFRNVGVEIVRAGAAAEALDAVKKTPIDVVIVSAALPHISGVDLVKKLRAGGFTGVIAVLNSDGKKETDAAATAAGATFTQAKPLVFDELAGRLVEHLLPSDVALVSEHWSNVQMRPLILAFLDRLDKQVRQLSSMLNDPASRGAVEKMCLDLRGSAGGYGFGPIRDAAGKLHDELAGKGSAETLTNRMRDLARLCESARAAKVTVEA